MGRVGLQIMALKSFLAALDGQDAYLLDMLTTNDVFKRELGPTRAVDALKVLFEEINAFSSGLTSPFQYTSPNTLRAQISAARMRITSRIEELNLTNNEESFQMEDLSMPEALDKRRVFVVHGRNMDARKAIFDFLPRINLDPIEWEEAVKMAGSTSASNLNAIERAFSHAQAAIIILTGDDLARLGKRYLSEHDDAYERDLTRQARPNVIFEAGMAFGLDPTRTVIVSFGKTRPISDIAGINILHLSDTPESRQKLAGRLKNAGCDVMLRHFMVTRIRSISMQVLRLLDAGHRTPPPPPQCSELVRTAAEGSEPNLHRAAFLSEYARLCRRPSYGKDVCRQGRLARAVDSVRSCLSPSMMESVHFLVANNAARWIASDGLMVDQVTICDPQGVHHD